jgi:putative transposase
VIDGAAAPPAVRRSRSHAELKGSGGRRIGVGARRSPSEIISTDHTFRHKQKGHDMKLTDEIIEQLKTDLADAKSYGDLMGQDGAIKKLMKAALEGMLDAELTTHLGYEPYELAGHHTGNSRNGKTRKRLKNDHGEIELAVPRDRNGSFDPIVVKKYERTIGPIEDKIISLYAKGMTVRDIQAHIQEIYGLEMSPTFISNVTGAVLEIVKQWHNRPLETVYPLVFFDGIFYKVQDEGKVKTKAAYTVLGIDITGRKDLLGIWIAESEGANFWTSICAELRNRGVEDIYIACVDGLKGFPDAIRSVFPRTEIQLCVIHMIRNTLKFIAAKDQKLFINDLRTVYSAPTREVAEMSLEHFEATWAKKYPLPVVGWREKWDLLSTYFAYPPVLRTVVYTTNAVEALHRQFRKVTKAKSLFTGDDALRKMLYLAYRDIAKKWTMPIRQWPLILTYFSETHKDRLPRMM